MIRYDILIRSISSTIVLAFICHSNIQAQSICGRAVIDSDNQIVLLSPYPNDFIPASWQPPIEKSYGIVTASRESNVCFAAITMNREVKVWGDSCEFFNPPPDLRDVKRLQMNSAVVIAEKLNGDYVVWGDSRAVSHFENRRLNSGSEQIKLDVYHSLGYLSNQGHTLTVCHFDKHMNIPEPDSCCHISTFHDESIRDFRMPVEFYQYIITTDNKIYGLGPARKWDNVSDFSGPLSGISEEYIGYWGTVDSEDNFIGCEGLLLRNGMIRAGDELYAMPYGNGQVLDMVSRGVLYDLVLLEDGRVVVMGDDNYRGPTLRALKRLNFENALKNARKATLNLRAYTDSYYEPIQPTRE